MMGTWRVESWQGEAGRRKAWQASFCASVMGAVA